MTKRLRSISTLAAALSASALFASIASAQVVRDSANVVVHQRTAKDDYKATAKADKNAYKTGAQAMKADAKATKFAAKDDKAAMKGEGENIKFRAKHDKFEAKDRAKAEKANDKFERKAPPLS
ncbi:MAG TPA: hypothetical protein VGM82_02265 [Gemmatimonadaceae bacterium]|jgi:lipopolysaccharide export system protein LptA